MTVPQKHSIRKKEHPSVFGGHYQAAKYHLPEVPAKGECRLRKTLAESHRPAELPSGTLHSQETKTQSRKEKREDTFRGLLFLHILTPFNTCNPEFYALRQDFWVLSWQSDAEACPTSPASGRPPESHSFLHLTEWPPLSFAFTHGNWLRTRK